MSVRCVLPPASAAKALTTYRSRRSRWLADPSLAEQDSLTVALHPPSEQQIAEDPDTVVAWVRSWRVYTGAGHVEWAMRRWPSFGTQEVPVRLTLAGAGQIASAGGRETEWRALMIRRDVLVDRLGPGTETLSAAVAATAANWLDLDDDDFVRLTTIARWLSDHPNSGYFIRQLPVPGVDTKWLSRHHGMVETLVEGVRGNRDLGIRRLPGLRDVALCDPDLLIGTPRRFATSLEELTALPLTPARTLILENKEGLYALPRLAGTVALHGGGYAVHELAGIPWVVNSEVWYWGDLDSHGFAILDRLRRHLPHVRSLLMDMDTLDRWRTLAVREHKPTFNEVSHLTESEAAALQSLREDDLRLEQERIPWPYALERLLAAVGPGQ
ncbi:MULTISPECIES: DUF3322 domain-containing protein [Rhodococcus]|uniref:Wadjet protein JetD C-terminal domain-containing protein n=1 Tax=Rhodococcus opacus RKJ300 = JCM 13270 TaxID=1165867 RepID=I0WCW5_RHOOP|nr:MULTISPECIES: Wadjet anti-phage system protein JetD domain-containing protein [Rhodococcus]EID74231.1 hypothetical protein W59_31139 [Rhodococcus opacus RKJ300 = JCM 13270]QQZ15750.1 hypothetical protein GO592_06015 [Rhodococcus sp. 21391]